MPLNPASTPFPMPPPSSASSTSSFAPASLNSSESSWTGIDTHSSYLNSSLRSDHHPSNRATPSRSSYSEASKLDPSHQVGKSTATPPPFFGSRNGDNNSSRDKLDATPQAPSRARSPSAPILPSQATPTSARKAGPSTWAFDPFSTDLDEIAPSRMGLYAASSNAYTGGILSHHKSVPNLGEARATHRRANASVRFQDQDISEDEAASEKHSEDSWGSGRLFGSRSLSNLHGVGQMRNVYIPIIDIHTTEEELTTMAQRFGVVKSVKIGNGEQRVFATKTHAFVMFERPEQAADFIAWLKERGVDCEYGKEDWQTEYKAREDPNSTNLYVVGLPINVDDGQISRLFNPYGVIKSLKLLSDTEGNRRGPILVRMESRPQAERAIRGLNGLTYPGALEKLQVRIADSDQQKNYKHNMRSKSSTSSIGAMIPENSPLPLSLDEERDLLERRFQLQQLLAQIDSQLGSTAPPSNAYATPRRFPASSRGSFSSPHTPSSPYGAQLHHRYSSSTFSDLPPTPTSAASTWSSAFDPNPFESVVMPTSLASSWMSSTSLNTFTNSLGGDVWARPSPARAGSFSNGPKNDMTGGLHHARSTPEFGKSSNIAPSGSASTIRATPSYSPAKGNKGDEWARTLWPETSSSH